MPAGPIGSCWANDSWSDLAWEANTWAGSVPINPTITTTTLPDGRVSVPYSQTVHAINGTLPYTWTIDSGSLPTSLNLAAATGVISGTPTVAGVYPFVIKVTDDDGNFDTQPLSITILAPLSGTGGDQGQTTLGGAAPVASGSTRLGGMGGFS